MVRPNNIASAVTLLASITAVTAWPDPVNWQMTRWEEYPDGWGWGSQKETVKQHIRNACNGYNGIRGFYQDVWFKSWNESPYPARLCVEITGGRVDFEIANMNPNQGFTLARDVCVNRLSSIVDRTPRGGESQESGWWARADPNEGRC